jgi:GNAT superfamily N-acetyltransferase
MSSKTFDLRPISIKPFNPQKTSQDIWNQFHTFNEKILTEIFHADALPDRKIVEKELCYDSPDYQVINWLIYKDKTEKELIAFCYAIFYKKSSSIYEENKDVSHASISVAKEYRRQGLGTLILKEIIKELEKYGIKYIKTSTKHISGWNYCEKHNAKLLNVMKKSRLDIKEVDWNLVEKWIAEGKQRNPEVAIEQFFGVSEENIEEYAQILTELMLEAPTLEDDEERETITPNRFREYVQFLENKTYKLFTLRSIEANGKVSGLTEIRFSDVDKPNSIEQGLTGVRKIYRGRGLGKWLKASLLLYIRENLPEREYLQTGNAEHNAPMLSINTRLGFKPYKEDRIYKFSIEKLKQELSSK